MNKLQKNIDEWYDNAMDRVSGWYRRSTQWIIFWIGLFIAVSMNVNTITIADYLYRNDAVRSALVARAEAALRIFQRERGMVPDGIAGPKTWAAQDAVVQV